MDIKYIYQKLSKKEKEVYNYVERNKDTVAYMNIREIAENCGVSTTTILRFVKKIGLNSYKEFKYWCLKKEDKLEFNYYTKEVINCLNKMSNEIFEEKLEEVAAIINECDFILFVGIGNSAGTALLGARYFSNFGVFSLTLNDPFYNLELLPKNMAVIILSVSGETHEIITETRNFINFNIPVITITSNENSTLSHMSDLTIAYYLRQQRKNQYFDMASQIPAVYIIERLANKIKK